MMIVRVTGLGLPDQDHGQDSSQKAGYIEGGTIYVLVNLCLTSVVLQVIFLHRESY